MVINQYGNVGLGLSVPPVAMLEVGGTGQFDGMLIAASRASVTENLQISGAGSGISFKDNSTQTSAAITQTTGDSHTCRRAVARCPESYRHRFSLATDPS